jgi:hypothetical protein
LSWGQMSEFPILCGETASMWPPGNSGASKGICGFVRILKVWWLVALVVQMTTSNLKLRMSWAVTIHIEYSQNRMIQQVAAQLVGRITNRKVKKYQHSLCSPNESKLTSGLENPQPPL